MKVFITGGETIEFFNTETISGLLSILVGSFFYYLTLDFPSIETDVLGAAFLPKLYSILLIIFGVILITKKLVKSNTNPENQEGEFKGFYGLSSMVIVLIYVLLLPYIGFYIATILVMLTLLYFLKVRKILVLLSVSVGVTLFVFILFEKLLKVPLPTGVLF